MLKNINMSAKVLMMICAFISTTFMLSGQNMAQINARFSNPRFDDNTRMYFLDVELNSKVSKEFLFGMNVRFFYDANMLEFQNFDQFTAGYGTLGESPRAAVSNGQAGVQMFNLKESTAFVNRSVQLTDENTPLVIVPEKWVKVFRACFKVPLTYSDKTDFCPSIIWDTKGDVGTGGFLMGDDGLVITTLENDPNTPEVSAPSHVNATFFNWEQNLEDGMPYGKPVQTSCVTISETTSTQDINEKGFALFQNEPNPFNRETSIQFILPSARQATFKFFDVSGKEIDQIKGEYKEGRNIINLARKPWMAESKVIFYQMETEGFRSKTLKMVLINE